MMETVDRNVTMDRAERSDSSFSSDASIEDNVGDPGAKTGEDTDVDDPGAGGEKVFDASTPISSNTFPPTEASVGLKKKYVQTHAPSLECHLGGVAIAPSYPKGPPGATELSTCPGVTPDPPPLARVAAPFLPFESDPAALDAHEFERVRNHWRWWRRMRAANHFTGATGFFHLDKLRASLLGNELFYLPRGHATAWPPPPNSLQIKTEERCYREYRRLLAENPYGPENLYASSCLRSFVGADAGAVCLAHTDYSRAVKVRTLRRSERGNRTPFRYLPECASGGAELVDYDLSKRQRVYGVARVAGDPLLFAVKYRHAVSLMDAEGDMKGHWKSVGKEDLADVAALPAQDSIASVDCAGNVRLISPDRMEVVSEWEKALKAHVGGYRWACVLEGSQDDPWQMAAAGRKAVALFDIRQGSRAPRILCKSVSSATPSSAFYVATSHGLHLLDERSLRNPVTTWRHLCGGEAVVVGCTAAVVDGVEYVATHARNGDVQLLANDWRHSECRNGRGFLQLSCQEWPEKRPEYPLSRSGGRMQNIPSVSSIINEFPFDSDVPVSHLVAPWVGMTMVSEKAGELSVIASNAAGALFCCDVGLREESIEEDAAAASDGDLFSVDEGRGAGEGKKGPKKSGAWSCRQGATDVERDWLKRWASHCEGTAYRKVLRLTAVYQRQNGWAEHMEAKNRFLHPIRRSWRYRQPDHARSALTRHDADVGGRSLAVRKTEAFKNARLLKPVDQLIREQRKAMKRNKKPVDESESGLWHRDEQAKRVLAIFNGDNPWKDDEEGCHSDAESLFECGKRRKRTPRPSRPSEASSGSETTPGIAVDRNFTLDNFLAGIEAGMTSTQETTTAAAAAAETSALEDTISAPPLVASQSVLDSTSQQQVQTTPAATRKKKKTLAGF